MVARALLAAAFAVLAVLAVPAEPASVTPPDAPAVPDAPSLSSVQTPPSFKPGDACPIPGRISAADGSLLGFTPDRHLYLEVEAKEAPAEIYRILGRSILVISPRLSSPVVLSASVLALVPPAKIDRHPDGTVDVRRDAQLDRRGSYQIDEASKTLTFSVDGQHDVLRVRPPLDFLRAPAAGSQPH